MPRETRPVIAINEATGERVQYNSVYALAKALGVRNSHVMIAISMGNAVNGWRVYDTPENIRKRIEEMERTIEMLIK